jgi:hypothetical protein
VKSSCDAGDQDGIGTIKTEKSRFTVTVTLPILPVLAETLTAGACGDLTFIAGERGQPLTKESFGNLLRAACREAGVPGSAHGVRKIAATRAANSGATVAQLEAIFGWSGGQMASHYTRSADRKRLALEGMHMLANEKRKSIPSPSDQVRARENQNKIKDKFFKWWGWEDSNFQPNDYRLLASEVPEVSEFACTRVRLCK